MIRGEDRWRAEYDRAVGGYRAIAAAKDQAWKRDSARAEAIAALKRLGLTAGEATLALDRPRNPLLTRG